MSLQLHSGFHYFLMCRFWFTDAVCPHLYGCRFGIHDFLVHSHRHHDGINFAELIFSFLRSEKDMDFCKISTTLITP